MTAKAYESTNVPVAKSQDELRGLLRKFGAQQFTMGEGEDWAGVEFVHADMVVRLRCPLRTGDNLPPDNRHRSTAEKEATVYEREAQRVWRVLVWSVKARLVAVDEGLETFEQAFLSHLVDPATKTTVWERVRDVVAQGALRHGGPGLAALMPGSG